VSANSRFTTAVHALCWLELSRRRGQTTLTSDRVAASLASHPVLVRRSLAPLRDAGLLETSRGPGAGWSLTRPGAEITLLDVHDALGRPAVFGPLTHTPNLECEVGFGIGPTLTSVYAELDEVLCRALERHTVADVLDRVLVDHPVPAGSRKGSSSSR